MPPETPPTPTPPPAPKPGSFSRLSKRANGVSGVVVLILGMLILGAGLGYLFFSSRAKPATTGQPQVTSLSADEIKKLTDASANLGNSNQTLTIAANALFNQKVDVTGDLTAGGRFNANGASTLAQVNITGAAAGTSLSLSGDLAVAGAATFTKSLTVQNLLAVNGGLNVSGSASVNSLNAASISTQTISISGPLIIGHLVTKGTTPGISTGAVGAGGTVNVNGNDTAGTVNINTGTGPSASTLATITFRAAFGGTPHVILTALTPSAAALQVYVTRSSTGFAIHAASVPPNGAVFSYDYIVAQ